MHNSMHAYDSGSVNGYNWLYRLRGASGTSDMNADNGADGKNDWYAVFVETFQEDKVKARLEYRFGSDNSDGSGLRILVPKRRLRERRDGKWRFVTRALFPGYVLLNGRFGAREYYRLKGVPGILKLLRTGYDFAKIAVEEIEILARLACNKDIIELSDVLVENGRVTVVDGPLLSLEGIIESINRRKGRARVRLNFLGEERSVELGVNVLQPCG